MKFTIISFVCAAAALGSFADEGYTAMFDGKTLTGWHIMEKPEEDVYHASEENFFAKDGALHCFQTPNQKGGLLLSDGKYSDFELIMDIKTDWGCDSGIFIRCQEDGRGIQILNDYLKDGCIGYLYGQGTGGYISRPIQLGNVDGAVLARDIYDGEKIDGLVYSIDAAGWNKLWKQDDWNTLKIRCVGKDPIIITWVNGIKVMEMDGRTYKARSLQDEIKQNWDAPSAWNSETVDKVTGSTGSIAVQIHPWGRWKQGGAAMYRNIRIKEL